MDFQAKFQVDAYDSYEGAQGALACDDTLLPSSCTWELHRSRIGIQGHLFKEIEYEVERELQEHELTEEEVLEGLAPEQVWKDVFVNVRYIRNAQVQVGRFKIPFGLDQLIGVSQNDFVFRSLGAIYLDPARDTGVMVHGRFFKRGLNYWVGGFLHDGDNARSKEDRGRRRNVCRSSDWSSVPEAESQSARWLGARHGCDVHQAVGRLVQAEWTSRPDHPHAGRVLQPGLREGRSPTV